MVLSYLLTILRTYIQVIFEGSHPTLKVIKQKMPKIIPVLVPNFFQKMTKLGPKNKFWDLEFKINPFESHPTLSLLIFYLQSENKVKQDLVNHIRNRMSRAGT